MDSGDPGIGRAARGRATLERTLIRRKEEGMARESGGLIWMNGKFVPFEDAKIHVLSHVVHYGSRVFVGVRGDATPRGPAAVLLAHHRGRLAPRADAHRRP